jgi:acetyl-CoA carboxylase biotin carboxyl carrier protein
MTIEEINQLIQTVMTSGIAELEVQRGENRVWIRRSVGIATQEYVLPAAPAPALSLPAAVHPAPHPPAPAPDPPAAGADLTDPSLIAVKSPIVGTFYESAKPGAPAFVQLGDAVAPGKILCIIESMKLMNEIECEHSGVIVKRLVENGQPVEFGETMFLIKPA